jgi:uncharacterized protein YbaR (Trm112 family)
MVEGKKFCPMCRSEDVAFDGSMIEASGGAMVCKKCGYRGLVFPIKEKITKLGKLKK